MTLRWKRTLVIFVIAGAVLAAIALGAVTTAPGLLRHSIERRTGETLGRELKISGAFDLSLSMTPTLTASDITLANVPWGSEPSMVRAGRIRVSLDLLSLWSGPVRARELTIEDVRVLLEADGHGRRNWIFETKPSRRPPGPDTEPPLVVERASIRRFELAYRPPPGAPPLDLRIDALDATLDSSSRMIEVRGNGAFNTAPWDIAGRLGTLEHLYEGHDLDQALTGHVGRATLALSGRIHDPMTLGGPKVEVSIDGPDVAEALAVVGFRSRLSGPFRLHGLLAPKDEGVSLEVSAAVGGVTATARGTVNSLLGPDRIDATVHAEGPDASVVGSWIGVRGFLARPFDLAGRIRRDGPRLTLDETTVRAGDTSLTVSGSLGTLPRCVGIDLTVAAEGSDLGQLSELTTVRLPSGRFDVRGRFLRREDGLAIDGAEVHVGGATIRASGTIGQPPRCPNLDLTAEGTGPDASILSGIATVELPRERFEIRGRVARKEAAVGLDGISGRLGDAAFEVDAQLVPVRGLAGTEARVRLSGSDLAKTAAFAGLGGVPAEAFSVAGQVRVTQAAAELTGVDARVGSLAAEVDGRVATPAPLDGTSLTCRVRGSALSDLAAWRVPAKLPAEPFTASGRLSVEGGIYRLDDAVAEIGRDRLAVDGTLGALPDASKLDVAMDASGPDLSAIGRFFTAAGADPPSRIPDEPFTVKGNLRRVSAGVELHEVKAGIGAAALSADGLVGTQELGLGTDLRFAAESPDASLASELLGVELPEGALRTHGRFRRTADGTQLDGAELSIGASFAQVSGRLGAPPRFAKTDLDVTVEGPDLGAVLRPLTGLDPAPSDSFALSAHVHGSTESFTSDRFSARLGGSDLEGRLTLRLEGRPFLDANVHSAHLDVPRLISGFIHESEDDASSPAPAKTKRTKSDRLIPDKPLALGVLGKADGHLQLTAAEMPYLGVPLRDVRIQGDLREGAIRVDRLDGTGENGGRASASAFLQPKGDGYWIHAEGRLDGGRLDLKRTGESPELAPSVDVEYTVDGTGRSLHEIAASADGHVLLMLGPGRIPNSLTDFMSSDVFIALFNALNPLKKTSKFTNMECGIAAAGIDDGKVVVQPIAGRSDKLTVIGNGTLDFDTERINVVWTIKPRRGVGLSAGSIANPYIKLGGTLAAPALDVKPLEALVSTSAAVVTAGLTILFRGIYNRITAEKKVCVQALEKARKQMDEREARKVEASSE